MLNAITLSVATLNVVMLSVRRPRLSFAIHCPLDVYDKSMDSLPFPLFPSLMVELAFWAEMQPTTKMNSQMTEFAPKN
jgi:hypothetical protein